MLIIGSHNPAFHVPDGTLASGLPEEENKTDGIWSRDFLAVQVN